MMENVLRLFTNATQTLRVMNATFSAEKTGMLALLAGIGLNSDKDPVLREDGVNAIA